MIHFVTRKLPPDINLEELLIAHAGPYRLGKTENTYLVLTESPTTPRLAHVWRHADGVKVAAIYVEGKQLEFHWSDDANDMIAAVMAAID